jgi:hypothetical protein
MYVYVIKTVDAPRCKIGKARNPERRLSELQTGNPMKLELLACIKCKSDAHALSIEKVAHRAFRGDSKRGEWFQYSGAIQRFVATAKRASEQAEAAAVNHRRLDREFWAAVEASP